MSTSNLIIAIIFALIVPASLSVAPVIFILLRIYRWYVIRLMGQRARPSKNALPVDPTPVSPPPATSPEFVFLNNLQKFRSAKPRTLLRRTHIFPWFVSTIYALGGICYTVLITLAVIHLSLIILDTTWNAYGFWSTIKVGMFIFPMFLFPTVLIILASMREPLSRAIVAGIYFLVLMIIYALAAWMTGENIIFIIAALMLLPCAMMLGLLYRGLQGIGPTMYVLLLFALSPLAILFLLLIDPWPGYSLLIFTIPFIYLFGGLVLFLIRWLYKHRLLSESGLMSDSVMLLASFLPFALFLPGVGAPVYMALIVPVILALYKIVTLIGFGSLALLDRKWRQKNAPQLLFLRVFSLGKRSERLFDRVAYAWRSFGSIRIITGPDLVTKTISPHNFLDFLSGRLSRNFIGGPKKLERRFAEMDLTPDPDGLFRINDFFCFEDTWRMVLTRLASDNVVVLHDLRQFSVKNQGCIYEITELINTIPLERVLFVVDDTTDTALLQRTILNSWNSMRLDSPNRQAQASKVQLFQFTGKSSSGFKGLLRALVSIVE